jgi:hypothetical protein
MTTTFQVIIQAHVSISHDSSLQLKQRHLTTSASKTIRQQEHGVPERSMYTDHARLLPIKHCFFILVNSRIPLENVHRYEEVGVTRRSTIEFPKTVFLELCSAELRGFATKYQGLHEKPPSNSGQTKLFSFPAFIQI